MSYKQKMIEKGKYRQSGRKRIGDEEKYRVERGNEDERKMIKRKRIKTKEMKKGKV